MKGKEWINSKEHVISGNLSIKVSSTKETKDDFCIAAI